MLPHGVGDQFLERWDSQTQIKLLNGLPNGRLFFQKLAHFLFGMAENIAD